MDFPLEFFCRIYAEDCRLESGFYFVELLQSMSILTYLFSLSFWS
jgi:hypothetical protein